MKKKTINDGDLRKYKINDCLLKMSMNEHREAVRLIPRQIGISLNTFHNYRNILINDRQDIPHEKVLRFEIFFGLKMGELLNKVIKGTTFKELSTKEPGKRIR
jgi:ACT domain-containing protein